jgi:hypothetical protein
MNRRFSYAVVIALVGILFVLLNSSSVAQVSAKAQSPFMVRPRDRVVGFIDEEQRAALVGSHHPLARAQYEVGGVKSDFRMEHVIMMLQPDAAQQKALENLLAAQLVRQRWDPRETAS